MKKRFGPLASASLIIVASFSLLLVSCGKPPYDINDPSSRAATLLDVQHALTVSDCADALSLITPLYNSIYSTNQVRMYYASAHGCNIGISFYYLLTQIAASDFSSIDGIFKSLVQLFPSTSLDTHLQSAWLATDALQSCLDLGPIMTAPDVINPLGFNPGSVRYTDRSADSNSYLMLISMAQIGNTLNRYGYTALQSPSGMGYAQGTLLPWVTKNLMKADNTGAGCALASGMLNLFDGITANSSILPSSISGAMTSVNTLLGILFTTAASAQCMADGFLSFQCDAAIERLRYRGACAEQDAAASAAAGIINVINAGWL